jgi:ATP-dependent helicase/nuclease subunit A
MPATCLWIFEAIPAEVPIFGNAAIPWADHRMFGIIDRLIITDTDVIAVDFKSNRGSRNTGKTPSGSCPPNGGIS